MRSEPGPDAGQREPTLRALEIAYRRGWQDGSDSHHIAFAGDWWDQAREKVLASVAALRAGPLGGRVTISIEEYAALNEALQELRLLRGGPPLEAPPAEPTLPISRDDIDTLFAKASALNSVYESMGTDDPEDTAFLDRIREALRASALPGGHRQ